MLTAMQGYAIMYTTTKGKEVELNEGSYHYQGNPQQLQKGVFYWLL
jgi:hypothetical protein